MNKEIDVAIVYQYIAHYRRGIFQRLSDQIHPQPVYTIYSGTNKNSGNDTIATIGNRSSADNSSEHDRVQIRDGMRVGFLRNRWLPKGFLWQTGLVRLALGKKHNCIIFLGDIHYISTWLAAVLARIRGKKILMWTHGFYGSESALVASVRRLFLSLAHGSLLYGHHAKNIMLKKGFNHEDMFVINNALNFREQRQHTESLSMNSASDLKKGLFKHPDLPLIIFSGRLIRTKRIEILLKMIQVFRSQENPINLVIVGDGPATQELKGLTLDIDISDYVSFQGPIYDEKRLAELFGAADLCVSPESIGLTAIHAMTYGVPVLTHDQFNLQKPEYEAIKPGVTGDFYRYGLEEDLYQKVKSWTSKSKQESATIKNACISAIENCYTPEFQSKVINQAVEKYFSASPAESCAG